MEAQRRCGKYAQGVKNFETLQAEVAKLEEDLESISYGLYRPHFTYEHSQEHKAAIQTVRNHQKVLIKNGQAVSCSTQWTGGGSAAEGAKMTKKYEKLILRAFNAESEAAIANVAWSNYRIMRERIHNSFEALNKLASAMQVSISPEYRDERLYELEQVFNCVN